LAKGDFKKTVGGFQFIVEGNACPTIFFLGSELRLKIGIVPLLEQKTNN
jgi:hypothetical protein